jgi:hydrogenase expression/formation protein HypC
MCIAAPGRILALDDGTAVVEVGGRRRRASLLMTPNVEIGAWVLVAAGNVVRRIDAAEASDLESQLAAAMAAVAPTPRPAQQKPDRPGGWR